MKKIFLPWVAAFAAIIILSASVLTPNGAPAAKTGSPGDGANCTDCHGGTATTTAGQITSNIPASGYVPGTTYQVTATNPLTVSGKMGFEVSPQNAAGALLGTLVAGTESKLIGSNKYVTHSNANTTTNSWTFGWIAPAAGTGNVTFYGAFARSGQGSVTLSSLTVQEALNTTGLEDNPASVAVISGMSDGSIGISLNTDSDQAKISVFDLSGRKLLNTTISGKGNQRLDKKFKTGVYIVVVRVGDTVLKRKIMIYE